MTEGQWVQRFAARMVALKGNVADLALIEKLASDAYLVMRDMSPELAADAQVAGDK